MPPWTQVCYIASATKFPVNLFFYYFNFGQREQLKTCSKGQQVGLELQPLLLGRKAYGHLVNQ